MVNKKGYFFVVDAIIATTIVMLGIFLLFSSHERSFDQEQPLTTLEDFMTITTAQSLSESTNRYYVTTLLPARVVPLPDMTPMEEVGYLLLKYNETLKVAYQDYATNFTEALFNDTIEDRYGVSLVINGTQVYARSNEAELFNLKRMSVLYVRMNETVVRGPMLVEVQIWG